MKNLLTTAGSVSYPAVMSDKTATLPCPHCDGKGRVPDAKAFGLAMRQKRERAKMSLRTVAAALGISAPYLSDMELGRRNFSKTTTESFNAALRDPKNRKPTKPTKQDAQRET